MHSSGFLAVNRIDSNVRISHSSTGEVRIVHRGARLAGSATVVMQRAISFSFRLSLSLSVRLRSATDNSALVEAMPHSCHTLFRKSR